MTARNFSSSAIKFRITSTNKFFCTSYQNDLEQAISQKTKKIIVLTHVPPFKEACLHQGKISSDDWLPYFSSKVMGDILITIAQENPDIEFLVLCGHTHSEANFQCYNNLTIEVGKAEYYRPEIQKIILI